MFDRVGLEQAWLALVDRLIRDATFAHLWRNLGASMRELRVVMVEAAVVLPPCLLDPEPVITAAPRSPCDGLVTVTCVVPFSGEAGFFDYAPPIWPPGRQVRGTTAQARVTLSAEAKGSETEWLPAVLASELAELHRLVAAQQAVMRHWDKRLGQVVRGLADKVHPRISPNLLRSIVGLAATINAEAPSTRFARDFLAGQRSKLWSDWTR